MSLKYVWFTNFVVFTQFFIFSVCGYIDPDVNTNETSMHHLNSPLDNSTKKSDQKGIKHFVLSVPPPVPPLTHCYLSLAPLLNSTQAVSSKSKSYLFKISSRFQTCSLERNPLLPHLFGTGLGFLLDISDAMQHLWTGWCPAFSFSVLWIFYYFFI